MGLAEERSRGPNPTRRIQAIGRGLYPGELAFRMAVAQTARLVAERERINGGGHMPDMMNGASGPMVVRRRGEPPNAGADRAQAQALAARRAEMSGAAPVAQGRPAASSGSPAQRAAELAEVSGNTVRARAAERDRPYLPDGSADVFGRHEHWQAALDDADRRWDEADKALRGMRARFGRFPDAAEDAALVTAEGETARLWERVTTCQHHRDEALREIDASRPRWA
jgi:hypothetical protein